MSSVTKQPSIVSVNGASTVTSGMLLVIWWYAYTFYRILILNSLISLNLNLISYKVSKHMKIIVPEQSIRC